MTKQTFDRTQMFRFSGGALVLIRLAGAPS